MKVFVLWENHADGHVHQFGPHVFLIACVAHLLEVDRYDLTRTDSIGGRPCKGNGNVRNALTEARVWDAAEHVVAVLDADQVHELLLDGSPALRVVAASNRPAWFRDRAAAVRAKAAKPDPTDLSIHLLDANIETLLEILDGPVIRKTLSRRDAVLQRAAADPASIRKAMTEMPTWAALVETIAGRLRPA